MNPQHSCLFASVKQTPRGSVVVLGDLLLTDEVSDEHAHSLAGHINHHILFQAWSITV